MSSRAELYPVEPEPFHGKDAAKVHANQPPLADSIEDAIYLNCHEAEKPLKAIASEMGVSRAWLYKASDPHCDEARFPLQLLASLTRVSQRYDAVRRACHDCGGVFVPLNHTGAFNARTAEILKETAEYLQTIAVAEADGRVTAAEAKYARAQGEEAIAAIEAHMRWMESRVESGR